jgi:hypothetical protein
MTCGSGNKGGFSSPIAFVMEAIGWLSGSWRGGDVWWWSRTVVDITSDAGLFSERGMSVDSCDIVALDRDHDFGNNIICLGVQYSQMGHTRRQAWRIKVVILTAMEPLIDLLFLCQTRGSFFCASLGSAFT